MNLREFKTWALNQGQVSNPPPNNKYPGQCVSLIQQYLYRVFNIPFTTHGNAKDWANNVPNGFSKLSTSEKLKAGDILVYGSNYGGGYGHMGIIDADMGWLDQNGVKGLAVGTRSTPFNGYICILRYNGNIDLGNEESFWVRVDKKEAAVRSEPNQNATQVGSKVLYKGNTFEAIGTVEGENIGGNNIWYKSWKGNYVWSGGLTRL